MKHNADSGADAYTETRTAYDARLARLLRADFVTGLTPETALLTSSAFSRR